MTDRPPKPHPLCIEPEPVEGMPGVWACPFPESRILDGQPISDVWEMCYALMRFNAEQLQAAMVARLRGTDCNCTVPKPEARCQNPATAGQAQNDRK